MENSDMRRLREIDRQLRSIARQEGRLTRAAERKRQAEWKTRVEEKLPTKTKYALEAAFCKGFSLVFVQGSGIVEKTYDREKLLADHRPCGRAAQTRGDRRELRRMHKDAKRAERRELLLTTAEGVGLGALGIGLPDIVLFLGMLLRGICESALRYGFDDRESRERVLMLKMMACALSTGEDYATRDREVDRWLTGTAGEENVSVEDQLKETAAVFAGDLLLLKSVQGLPVVGVIGGAANPVYYHKVLRYVQLKYRKRYLLDLRKKLI